MHLAVHPGDVARKIFAGNAMTTIADLLALPSRGTLTGADGESVLLKFLEQFDRSTAQELCDGTETGTRLPGGTVVEILLDGTMPLERCVLARLAFGGEPVALVRREWSHGDDVGFSRREDRSVAVLVHRGRALALVEACIALVREQGGYWDGMAAADPAADAGQLTDFGPTGDVEFGTGTIVFRPTTVLAYLQDRFQGPLASLVSVEGRGLMIGHRDGSFDRYRAAPSSEGALEAFLDDIRGPVEAVVNQRGGLAVLHLRVGPRSSLAVSAIGPTPSCRSTTRNRTGHPSADGGDHRIPIDEAKGDEAIPTFFRLAREAISDAVAVADRGPAAMAAAPAA